MTVSADAPSADASQPFKVETLLACPLCGGETWSLWAEAPDYQMQRAAHVFRYARCGACAALFEQERPTEATVSYFYEGDYEPYRKKRKKPFLHAFHKLGQRWASRISGEQHSKREVAARRRVQLSKPGAALLDFGCGGGRYMDACKARFGCRTIGMDFNASLFAGLRARGHEAFDVSDASWAQLADNSIDIVVMSHVLEHVYAPRAVLGQVLRVLKPGGLLDISVPNPDGYSAALYGEHWFGLDSPRHIILYGPEVASKLVADVGFIDIEVVAEPVTKDALRSMTRQAGAGAPAVEGDGGVALKTAFEVRRAADAGKYDRFHLFARKAG